MQEYRAALVAAETPEERHAFVDAPLNEQRNYFGLGDPSEHIMPKVNVAEYNAAYGGWESDFLVAARQQGLDSKLVSDIRDAGIRIAIEADGKPVSDDAWTAMEKRFAGRLTTKQFNALRTWWKNSVEGAA